MKNNNKNIDKEISDFLESLKSSPVKRKNSSSAKYKDPGKQHKIDRSLDPYSSSKFFSEIAKNNTNTLSGYLIKAKRDLTLKEFNDMTSATVNGDNALHLVVEQNNFYSTGLILEHCPKSLLTQSNDDGKIAIELAQEKKYQNIVDLITSLGELKPDDDEEHDLDSTQEINISPSPNNTSNDELIVDQFNAESFSP